MEKETEIRNWIELPSEVWGIILSKVKTMDIIENVQKVCMLFRSLCKKPSMYAAIDMSTPVAYGFTKIPIDIHALTCYAVNRSVDRLTGVTATHIYIEYFCEPKTFKYIAGRCNRLKKLSLAHFQSFPAELYQALIKAIISLPLLEEVQFKNCHITTDMIEGVGRACPSLKSFGLTEYFEKYSEQYSYSMDALAISRSMSDLRQLTITGNGMTNGDLELILDGCCFLEYLDLRGCPRIYLSGNLGKRCEGIKHLRPPHDPIKDIVAEKQVWNDHYRVQHPEQFCSLAELIYGPYDATLAIIPSLDY